MGAIRRRSGAVLAAVTGVGSAPAGFSSQPLGAMRYVAAASPAFVARYFAQGVNAASLARAPSLQFNAKDALQARWVERQCGGAQPALPRHTEPSLQAFVATCVACMGWAMQPQTLIQAELQSGTLVELVPHTPLDVPLRWQQARAGSALLDGLTRCVMAAARGGVGGVMETRKGCRTGVFVETTQTLSRARSSWLTLRRATAYTVGVSAMLA